MDWSLVLCKKLRKNLANTVPDVPAEILEQVEYGLYIFISNMVKSVLTLFIAALFGLFYPVAVAFLSFGVLRIFAGGIHAKKSSHCFFIATIIYFLIACVASIIVLTPELITTIFLVCLLVVLRYAPADVKEKPIHSQKQRKLLLRLSVVTLVLLYIIAMFFLPADATIVTFAVSLECFSITPFAYYISRTERG